MKLSMRWLRDYVPMDKPIEQYIEDMTMSGTKVEGVEQEGKGIANVVVGKILSITKHPDADTLLICQVEVGEEAPLQIVTGANNMQVGDFVPVAKHGATLPDGTQIKKGKLRGEESCGMLCSLGELNLTHGDFPETAEDGIFVLEEEVSPGTPITEAIGLDDTIVEFEITSNRPDCMAVLGIARETAATYGRLFVPAIPQVKGGGTAIGDILSLEVKNTTLCSRYMAAAVENVTIAPSPRWMRERLRASGVRPINNIVDITNYVMLEYGHPMHAFDLRHVAGNQIIVRNASAGEAITTLDGTERTLTQEMLVIADQKAPSAIAGVMGGEYSGIYPETRTVIFEAACFDGPSVRRTSRALGMRTESSGRFEKGLDPQNCLPALQRACELVELLGAGTVAEGFLDSSPSKPQNTVVTLDADWVNRYIGISIPKEEMVSYLENLSFVVEGDKVTVPSFRRDVKAPVDLAEEIARFYGYNNIPTTIPSGVARGMVTAEQHYHKAIENTLVSQGYTEIITYSFVSPKEYDNIQLPADSPLRKSIALQNPLGEDTSIMRTTAVPSMIRTLAYNYNNRNEAADLFEIATEYRVVAGEQLPHEGRAIVLGQYGEGRDFFTIKGGVEVLLKKLGAPKVEYVADRENPTFHPGRCANILCGEQVIGVMGELHPSVQSNYGLGEKTYLATLEYETLLEASNPEPSYKPLPRYPASTRDLALVSAEELPVGEIEKVLRRAIGSLLEQVELFDIYRGAQLGKGKKSAAFALTLRAEDRTLTDKESDRVVQQALDALKEIEVSLRE